MENCGRYTRFKYVLQDHSEDVDIGKQAVGGSISEWLQMNHTRTEGSETRYGIPMPTKGGCPDKIFSFSVPRYVFKVIHQLATRHDKYSECIMYLETLTNASASMEIVLLL